MTCNVCNATKLKTQENRTGINDKSEEKNEMCCNPYAYWTRPLHHVYIS